MDVLNQSKKDTASNSNDKRQKTSKSRRDVAVSLALLFFCCKISSKLVIDSTLIVLLLVHPILLVAMHFIPCLEFSFTKLASMNKLV